MIGGTIRDPDTPYRTAELYDPATDSFTPTTGSMQAVRFNHTATLLGDGTKVLLTGGSGHAILSTDYAAKVLASAELFDSATGMFVPAGDLNIGRGVRQVKFSGRLILRCIRVAGRDRLGVNVDAKRPCRA